MDDGEQIDGKWTESSLKERAVIKRGSVMMGPQHCKL